MSLGGDCHLESDQETGNQYGTSDLIIRSASIETHKSKSSSSSSMVVIALFPISDSLQNEKEPTLDRVGVRSCPCWVSSGR